MQWNNNWLTFSQEHRLWIGNSFIPHSGCVITKLKGEPKLLCYIHISIYNGVHNCHMEIRKQLCGLRNRYTATHPIKFEYNNKRIFGMCSTRLLST